MKKNNKISVGLWSRFVGMIFVMLLTTCVLTVLLVIPLIKIGFINLDGSFRMNPLLPLIFLSVTIGTFISVLSGRMFLRPIVKLKKATKSIAKGDFTVKLDEKQRVREIQEMFSSFNKMANDLSNMETFRNDFIANVSHEFKTPISAIEGYATLLMDDSLDSKERHEYAGMILNSARQLSTLSSNILKISKLESQEIIINKTDFSLDEQIREIILLYESEWSSKNLDMDINLEEITYHGSEELLFLVWQNLLGNAIKFTPENGIIRITLIQSENDAIATISDSGTGISKEDQKHIFDKFYQGDQARKQDGNGLGLTLVKRITDLSGGSITVSSEKKVGSTFIVRLPMDESN